MRILYTDRWFHSHTSFFFSLDDIIREKNTESEIMYNKRMIAFIRAHILLIDKFHSIDKSAKKMFVPKIYVFPVCILTTDDKTLANDIL